MGDTPRYSPRHGVNRVVSTGRLVMGMFLCLGLVVDPAAAGRHATLVRVMAPCCFVYLLTTAASWWLKGAHHRRRQRMVDNLACWPSRATSEEEALHELLAHASETLGAPRVVLAWEDDDEPWLRVASLDETGWTLAKMPPDSLGGVVADRLTTTFMCEDLSLPQPRAFARSARGLHGSSGAVLSTEFLRHYPARSVLALRLAGQTIQGWLLALDTAAMSIDDLVLGERVARLATATLEREAWLHQLRDDAAAEERRRLSRELHDGVLQALTAIALQVQAARQVLRLDAAAAEERLIRVQDTVLAEQRAIRDAVDTLNPRYARFASKTDTLSRVRDCVSTVARQWDLRARIQIPRTSVPVPPHTLHEISRMAGEALANAARHGAARDVTVECDVSTTAVVLAVEHRGRGFTGLNGRYDLAALARRGIGPRTLMDRATALGGSLSVVSHLHGARIEIDVPIGMAHAESPRLLPLARSS